MSNYEVHGIGFPNKGAELLLSYAVMRMEMLLPGSRFICQPNGIDSATKILSSGGLLKLFTELKGIDVRWLTSRVPTRIRNWYGLAVEGDSLGVVDASGFAYGDFWGVDKVRRAARRAVSYRRRGGFYVLLPQSFGPFSDHAVAKEARRLIRASNLVFARDEASLAHLEKLNTGREIQLCCDITVDADVSIEGLGWKPLDLGPGRQALVIPNEKLLTHGGGGRDRVDYIRFLAASVTLLQQAGFSVGLLNHEGDGDNALCVDVLSALPTRIPYVHDLEAAQIKQQIGSAHFVLSSRYHGAVSALSQGVPCAILGWSHKYQGLAQDFEMVDWCLEGPLDDCLEQVASLLPHAATATSRLRAVSERLQADVAGCWAQVAAVVAQTSRRMTT